MTVLLVALWLIILDAADVMYDGRRHSPVGRFVMFSNLVRFVSKRNVESLLIICRNIRWKYIKAIQFGIILIGIKKPTLKNSLSINFFAKILRFESKLSFR